jgi:hypothetical protein
MKASQFYDFLKDEALAELIELNKVTDDLFDVIDLRENQHSRMLAWLLNPNEGHMQGDSIIKDFLVSAYHASNNATWDNKKFFEKWTPGRIRTASFGSTFVITEFKLENKSRPDLLLIDPSNKILVVVENKFGARTGENQLEKYVDSIKKTLPFSGYFRGYDTAFVYLDVKLDDLDDEDRKGLSKRWSHLSYEWLRASARRAEFQLSSNRNSAKLLISYVQKQTEWVGQDSRRKYELASDLAINHPEVAEKLGEFSIRKVSLWDGRSLNSSHLREATIFHAQNSEICERIVEMSGLAAIEDKICRQNDCVGDCSELNRKKLWITASAVKRYMGGMEWPAFIGIHEKEKRYSIKFRWAPQHLSSDADENSLRGKLTEGIPGLKGNRRWINIKSDLDKEATIKEAGTYLRLIDKSFRE